MVEEVEARASAEASFEGALRALIDERLLDARARRLGIAISEGEIDQAFAEVQHENKANPEGFLEILRARGYSLASYRAFLRATLARQELIEQEMGPVAGPSESEVRGAYARMVQDEAPREEVHARHIVVRLPAMASPAQTRAALARARELAVEARRPGVDFAALAREKSEGASAASGGDLGFFGRGVMARAFEEVAFRTPVAGVSEPVRSPFGFHIITVEARRKRPAPTWEQEAWTLWHQLVDRCRRDQKEEYLRKLRADAAISLGPAAKRRGAEPGMRP
jgi:peptidyl-prolyl cis-trans isomerase SurA